MMQMDMDTPSSSNDAQNNLNDTVSDCVEEQVTAINPLDSNPSAYYEATEKLKKSLVKIYPWILDFRNQCQKQLVKNNIKSLKKLINFYIENVRSAVVDCYQKPIRAAKLKIELSYTLMFFHYTYRELKLPLEHFSYLEKLSELVAMHMDMELKASRNGNESINKVASIITSELKTLFGNYPEYILDSILKTNIITKKYHALGDLIFRWVLRDSPESPLDIIGYIRYILVYKRWKEIMCLSKKEQQQIITLACLKLQPPIGLKERLESNYFVIGLFPTIPNSEVTKFLMMAKFSSKEKSKIFFKILATPVALASLTYPSCHNAFSLPLVNKKGNDRVSKLLNSIWKKDLTTEMEEDEKESVVKKEIVINEPELRVKKEKKDTKMPEKKTEKLKAEVLKQEDPKVEDLGTSELCMKSSDLEGGIINPCIIGDESIYDKPELRVKKDIVINKPELQVEKEKKDIKMPGKKTEELIAEVLKPEDPKVEDLGTSELCMKSSDLEDGIINPCIIGDESMYYLIDFNVGEGECSSNLPLKKRRLVSCNRFNRNDNYNDASEINSKPLPGLIFQTLDSKIPLNPSTSNSNVSCAVVSNFCEPYKPFSSALEWRNCEEYNISEYMNSGEYYVPPPYITIVNTEEEEKKVFKTPAQLKAFHNSFNKPPDLIKLALESHADYFYGSDKSYEGRTASVVGRRYERPREVKDSMKSDDPSS